MNYKNRIQLILLVLSLIIGGAGTYFFARELPMCDSAPMAQLAWWGGVYPEYCLPGAVALVGEDDGGKTETPVKIRFKYLTFLNE